MYCPAGDQPDTDPELITVGAVSKQIFLFKT